LRFFFAISESTQNKWYTGYACRLSILEIHYKFRREHSTNAKNKEKEEGKETRKYIGGAGSTEEETKMSNNYSYIA